MGFWNRFRNSDNYTDEQMLSDHEDSTALFYENYTHPFEDEIPVEPNNDDDIQPTEDDNA